MHTSVRENKVFMYVYIGIDTILFNRYIDATNPMRLNNSFI